MEKYEDRRNKRGQAEIRGSPTDLATGMIFRLFPGEVGLLWMQYERERDSPVNGIRPLASLELQLQSILIGTSMFEE